MEQEIIKVTGESAGARLDVFLSGALGITRSFAQRLIKEGRVSGAGAKALKPWPRAAGGRSATR